MAGTNHSKLLSIPPELRLQIYEHLVSDCLATSLPKDFTGIFLSCQQLHYELKEAYVKDLTSVFMTKRRWEDVTKDTSSLAICLHEGRPRGKKEVCIDMDLAVLLHLVDETAYSDMPMEFTATPINAARILEPLLGDHDWRLLTINIHRNHFNFSYADSKYWDTQRIIELLGFILQRVHLLPNGPDRITVNFISEFDVYEHNKSDSELSSEISEQSNLKADQYLIPLLRTIMRSGCMFGRDLMIRKASNNGRTPLRAWATRTSVGEHYDIGFIWDFSQQDLPIPANQVFEADESMIHDSRDYGERLGPVLDAWLSLV